MKPNLNTATIGGAFQHTLAPSAMRAYFAAHAPEVPDWFSFDYPPKDLEAVDINTATTQDWINASRRDAVKRRAADREAFFAWRLFYADQMIAALEAK